jgi:cell division protein FtsB
LTASVIAAEIDALTAQLAEARAERDRLQKRVDIYNTSRDAVIAQLCAEADEARAQIAALAKPPSDAMIEQVCDALSLEVGPDGILNRSRASETIAGWLSIRYRNIDEQHKEIAALRAQIAALTLQADVGNAYMAWNNSGNDDTDELSGRLDAALAAAARAREVKP